MSLKIRLCEFPKCRRVATESYKDAAGRFTHVCRKHHNRVKSMSRTVSRTLAPRSVVSVCREIGGRET